MCGEERQKQNEHENASLNLRSRRAQRAASLERCTAPVNQNAPKAAFPNAPACGLAPLPPGLLLTSKVCKRGVVKVVLSVARSRIMIMRLAVSSDHRKNTLLSICDTQAEKRRSCANLRGMFTGARGGRQVDIRKGGITDTLHISLALCPRPFFVSSRPRPGSWITRCWSRPPGLIHVSDPSVFFFMSVSFILKPRTCREVSSSWLPSSLVRHMTRISGAIITLYVGTSKRVTRKKGRVGNTSTTRLSPYNSSTAANNNWQALHVRKHAYITIPGRFSC